MAAVRRRDVKVRLKRWPTEDWYYTHPGYRFIKAFFHGPVNAVARMRVRGAANVPSEGPLILAINHLSWADPVVVGAAIHRPAFYLAKEGVFKNPAMRVFLESMGQIKVNRIVGGNDAAVDTAVELLRHGLVVGVFPEGTRSRPGHVKRGKTGLARIAALSGAPVVPIGCETGDFWPKERALPRWGRKVYIDVGAPMRLDLKPEDIDDRVRMREATDLVMERVRELYGNAVKAREGNERWDG